MGLRRIVPGIYAIEGLKTGRAYLVEGDAESLALIDTSTTGVDAPILAAVEASGHSPRDLRAIIATHYHYDHTGNAEALRRATGARLHVHAHDTPFVDGTSPWLRATGPLAALERMGPEPFKVAVDTVLHDGDILPFAGGLRVVHAPGHTPGHVALHAAALGVLFAGDAFMNVAGLRLPIAFASHDMDAARRSARALAALSYEIALPGHGQPVLGRASEKVGLWTRAWL